MIVSKFQAHVLLFLKSTSSFYSKHLIDIEKGDLDFVADYNIVINNASIMEEDNEITDSCYIYVDMDILLLRKEDSTLLSACVKRRALDNNDELIGKSHSSPLLDL